MGVWVLASTQLTRFADRAGFALAIFDFPVFLGFTDFLDFAFDRVAAFVFFAMYFPLMDSSFDGSHYSSNN
jgi:hypothetical protein